MNGNFPTTLSAVLFAKRNVNYLFQGFFILGLALVLSFNALALTESYSIDSSDSILNGPSVRSEIDQFLEEKGWNEGLNTKANGGTFFISIGEGTIGARRDSNNYISSRYNAFSKAYLDAQKKLVQFLEAEISTNLGLYYSEPSEAREKLRVQKLLDQGMALEAARAQVDAISADVEAYANDQSIKSLATAGTLSKRLLTAQINRKLQELGLDPNQPVDKQNIEKIKDSEEFKSQIKVVAQSRIAGLQVYKTFEVLPEGNQGQIGVITIYSERLHEVANILFSGNYAAAKLGVPGIPIKEQIPNDPEILLSTFGVMVRKDEIGQMTLVGFGQAGAKTDSTRSISAAGSKARQNAVQQIRLFAASNVEALESSENSENMLTLQDNTILSETDDSYEERIGLAAKGLKISGIQNLYQLKTRHPLTNHVVALSVVTWSPKAGEVAAVTKKRMMAEPEKNKGYKNINSHSKAKKSQHSNNPGAKKGTFEKKGLSGSNDF